LYIAHLVPRPRKEAEQVIMSMTPGYEHAGSGNVRQRNRDWDIDTNLSHVDFILEFACGSSRLGEDGGTVTIFIGIDNVHSIVKRFGLHHYKYRPKYFFTVDV
jgi:hypothetical protein